MSDKLISLDQLQEYKTYADAKYQNKLTAGSNITISNNVISANGIPIHSGALISGWPDIPSSSASIYTAATKVGEVTLQPGIYFVEYTCMFMGNTTGSRRIAISTNQYVDGLGYAYMDIRMTNSGANTMTAVIAIINVSASEYPNGRTFNFLAAQNSGSTLTTIPRAFYLKFT